MDIILNDYYSGSEFMPRKNRVIFDGALYHVFHRGNNREYIFGNDKHKAFFLKEIKEYQKKFDYELLAYVIMDNHYHLIVRTIKSSISEIMFNINNVMGKYLNRELNRTGHIFEERYNCKIIDSDSYLVWLLRYIHRNPIRANICSDLNQYKWSSHCFYKNGISSELVNSNFILSIFSENKRTAIENYMKLMNIQENEQDQKSDFELIEKMFELNSNKLITISEINNNNLIKRESLEDIFMSIFTTIETQNLIKSKSKSRNLTPLKLEFIKKGIKNKYSLKEISPFLNLTDSAISKFLLRHNASI